MKLTMELHFSVYMKMENNPLLLKTFTVNNQLDLDFYIRGRHEGADNSLCKSRPVMLLPGAENRFHIDQRAAYCTCFS